MRTFALTDGNGYRWFWNIEVAGPSWTVTAGKEGTPGQKRTRSFPDAEQALASAEAHIREKLAKGYSETTPTPPPLAPPHLREALEQALTANPDDLSAHAAYADLLMEHDAPALAARGEFIQVQLALEDALRPAEERKRLQRREQELLDAHRRAWLGGMAQEVLGDPDEPFDPDDAPCAYHFARGWLSRMVLGRDYSRDLARAIAQAPETRLVRELILESDERDYSAKEDDASRLLARSPSLGNVRVLRIGREVEADEWGTFNGTISRHFVDLVASLPHLEELHALVNGYDPAPLYALGNLTSLRVLRLYHLQRRHPLEVLADNPALGNLTHLLLHPHRCEIEHDPGGPFLDLAGGRALLHSPHLKKLTHLQLRLCAMGDAGVSEIIRSGILKRLRVLDLRHGCVTDEGARMLASCPDLKRLERLDVDRNALTPEGVAALRSVVAEVRGDDQQTPQELGNRWYLYEGDTE
jgi:uncharacterized protein (TIGR02996 family)